MEGIDCIIDTAAGIRVHLQSFEGLQKLSRLRAEWAKRYRDSPRYLLKTWFLYGTWILEDQNGLVSRVDFKQQNLSGLLPDVICAEDVRKVIPNLSYSYGFGRYPLPKTSGTRCETCDRKFDIKDINEIQMVTDPGADVEDQDMFYHETCLKFDAALKAERYFSDLIHAATKLPFTLEPIKNEYGAGSYTSEWPWYSVRFWAGALKIGWRKRVVNIDWSELKHLDRNKLEEVEQFFRKENVTFGGQYIHAWGRDKAKDYVIKILDCLPED